MKKDNAYVIAFLNSSKEHLLLKASIKLYMEKYGDYVLPMKVYRHKLGVLAKQETKTHEEEKEKYDKINRFKARICLLIFKLKTISCELVLRKLEEHPEMSTNQHNNLEKKSKEMKDELEKMEQKYHLDFEQLD